MFMGDGGNATMNMSGGTLAVTGRFNMAGGQSPVVNQTGGTLTVGSDINVGDNNGTIGTYNISNGTLQAGINGSGAGNGVGGTGGAMDIGWNNTGTVNQTGGLVDLSSASAHGLEFGGNGGSGTYNLSGGVLVTPIVFKSTGTGTINFNGGTLRAAAADNVYGTGDNFMGNMTAANVQAGGAIVDTNSFAITISNNLLHDPGLPATTADGGLKVLDSVGGGSLTLTGDNTFNGITNVVSGTLNVNSANALGGSTLNLVPANAGTLNFGNTGTTITAYTLGGIQGSNNLSLQDTGANNFALTVGGNGFSTTYSGVFSNGSGLTKVGAGTLTLTAAQNYGGSTRVNGGNLRLTSPASLPAGSAVTVGGASATESADDLRQRHRPRIADGRRRHGRYRRPRRSGHQHGWEQFRRDRHSFDPAALTLDNGSVLDFELGRRQPDGHVRSHRQHRFADAADFRQRRRESR